MTAVIVTVMVVMYSFQSLFCKLFSQSYGRDDASLTTAVFSIAYGGITGLVTLIVAGFRFAPSGVTWLYGVLEAFMLTAYNTSMIQASRRGSYAFQMIACLFGGILMPMMIGAIWGGKAFTLLQITAIVMMLVSFVLMNLKGLNLKSNPRAFYVWCAVLFLANGFYGVILNAQAEAMAGAQRNEMIIITFLLMAVASAGIQLIRDRSSLRGAFRMSKKALIYLIVCSVVAATAVHMALYVLSLFENETVLFTIDNGGVLVLSVLYSIIIFGERPNAAQVAGMVMALISIIMLSV